jgi:hypothetical protein
LIIYDADEANTIPRVKIGDGNRSVSDLPFIGEDVLQKISEIELLTIIDEGEGNLVFDGVGYGGYEDLEVRIENLESGGDDINRSKDYLVVYLYYNEEDDYYYTDKNAQTIYNAVYNEFRDVQLIYETEDSALIYNLQYCNVECAVFGYRSGGYAVSFAIYDDGTVDYIDASLASTDYVEDFTTNYALKNPTKERNTCFAVVGLGTDGQAYKMTATYVPSSGVIAKYDDGGHLYSEYYDEQNEKHMTGVVATEPYVAQEIEKASFRKYCVYAWAAQGEDYFCTEYSIEEFEEYVENFTQRYIPIFLVLENDDATKVWQCMSAEYNTDDECFTFYDGRHTYHWEKADCTRIYI